MNVTKRVPRHRSWMRVFVLVLACAPTDRGPQHLGRPPGHHQPRADRHGTPGGRAVAAAGDGRVPVRGAGASDSTARSAGGGRPGPPCPPTTRRPSSATSPWRRTSMRDGSPGRRGSAGCVPAVPITRRPVSCVGGNRCARIPCVRHPLGYPTARTCETTPAVLGDAHQRSAGDRSGLAVPARRGLTPPAARHRFMPSLPPHLHSGSRRRFSSAHPRPSGLCFSCLTENARRIHIASLVDCPAGPARRRGARARGGGP